MFEVKILSNTYIHTHTRIYIYIIYMKWIIIRKIIIQNFGEHFRLRILKGFSFDLCMKDFEFLEKKTNTELKIHWLSGKYVLFSGHKYH